MTGYVLRPRPPIRAFAMAAVLSLVGAGLLVGFGSRGVLGGQIAGWIVLGVGLLLGVIGLVSMRTMRVLVDLDDEGFRVHGPGVDKRSDWSSITKVVSADDGARLIFHHGAIERTHLWCPMGAGDPQMQALAEDVARRLDAANGYRHLIDGDAGSAG